MYPRVSRPTAHLPSGAISISRIVSSVSRTKCFAAMSNAWRKVKSRSWLARFICADWIRSSALFHTSTSADSSVVLRDVGGVGTCSLMPKNTRWLSSLQVIGARSLTTQPLGKLSVFAGSRTTGVTVGASLFAIAGMSVTVSRTLSFSRILSTSVPLSTATAVPSSFHASRA